MVPYRLYIIIAIVIAVVGGVGWKLYDLNNEIEKRDNLIKQSKANYNQLNTEYLSSKLQLLSLEASNKELTDTVDKTNAKLEEMSNANATVISELEIWKHKEPEIKYKTVYKVIYKDNNTSDMISKGDCAAGLKLNMDIANLRYDQLGRDK